MIMRQTNKQKKCLQVFSQEISKREPKNYTEAVSCDECILWRQGINEEFDNLEQNKVWAIVDRAPGMRTLKTRWTFKAKQDENGVVARHKARLVALGNDQRPGIDFEKTYSPVVKMKSTRIIMDIAAQRGWEVDHLDAITAYLSAELNEEIYIEVPQGYEEYRNTGEKIVTTNKVCKLNAFLYGLHQSGHEWYKKLSAILIKLGFKQSKADPCFYYHKKIIIMTYVDDFLVYGKRKDIDEVKKRICQELNMRDLGRATYVQSIRVVQLNGQIRLDQ